MWILPPHLPLLCKVPGPQLQWPSFCFLNIPSSFSAQGFELTLSSACKALPGDSLKADSHHLEI